MSRLPGQSLGFIPVRKEHVTGLEDLVDVLAQR